MPLGSNGFCRRGAAIPAAAPAHASRATPPPGQGWGAALVTISDLKFDAVKFTNIPAENAFEFSNLSASPIPLPAAGWLLIGGMGALGALGYRRRKAAA